MKLKGIVIVFSSLVLFIIIVLMIFGAGDIIQGDEQFFMLLNPGQGHPTVADSFFTLFVAWGPGHFGFGLYGILFLLIGLGIGSVKFPRFRYILLVMGIGFLLYLGTDIILGLAVPRDRPFLNISLASNAPDLFPNFLQLFSTTSFPSTHTGVAFAILGPIIIYGRYWAKGLAISYGGLIAYSRIFVGVHYPLDVMVGALVGFLISLIIAFIFRAWLDAPQEAALNAIKKDLNSLMNIK